MSSRPGGVAWLCLIGLACGCAGRIPLPKHLAVNSTPELLDRVRQNRAEVHNFTAEARLAYFGPQGRIRSNAVLAVKRPGSLRYELRGPHGGVLSAFATGGTELALLDMQAPAYYYGPATSANLDRLLAFAPLGLSVTAWVGLFFGEVEIPPTAAHRYDETRGRFLLVWKRGGIVHQVEVDPHSSQILRILLFSQQRLVGRITLHKRDPLGIPTHWRLEAPEKRVDLEVIVREIEPLPILDDSVFLLEPPRGVPTTYLGCNGQQPLLTRERVLVDLLKIIEFLADGVRSA